MIKKLLLIFSLLLLFPSTSSAGWKVETITDPVFETSTTSIYTTSLLIYYGNSISIKYAFIIEPDKNITVMLTSYLAIFASEKIDDLGSPLTTIFVKLDKQKAKSFDLNVGRTYRFLYGDQKTTQYLIDQNALKTLIRFNVGDEYVDVVFKTSGLKKLLERYRKK